MRVLALCDDPSRVTGFARVAMGVLSRWHDTPVDIWSINGSAVARETPAWRRFAAPDPWWQARGLTGFLDRLTGGGYSHAWMLNDLGRFIHQQFPQRLATACRTSGIRTLLYFPIDSAVEPASTGILDAVDTAATYTLYGAAQVRAAGHGGMVHVVPHGVDTSQFAPVSSELRAAYRRQLTTIHGDAFAQPEDFLLLTVNTNDARKDPARTMQILAGLRAAGLPVKLVLRMELTSQRGGADLREVGKRLGLMEERDWMHLPGVSERALPALYNAADLFLTTTLGEGWGMGITEALACGLPVAVPRHTACAEIGAAVEAVRPDQVVWLELEPAALRTPDGRLRRRVDVAEAVSHIVGAYRRGAYRYRLPLSSALSNQWDWDRIAATMLTLLRGDHQVSAECDRR